MKHVTFITGNQSKADYLAKYLGHPIDHQKVEQDEIQSLNLEQVVDHKAKQAYRLLKSPVLVEDVSLEFKAMGQLPGTFIKFFLEEMDESSICRLVIDLNRSAVAKCIFGYYDGAAMTFFKGRLEGKVAKEPAGDGGYGWDRLFIPNGYDITRAQMDEADYRATYLKIKPLEDVKKFLLEN